MPSCSPKNEQEKLGGGALERARVLFGALKVEHLNFLSFH
jgi:hypothetical protein